MLETVLHERIQKIRLVAMDVDGVLTDGRIVLGNYGDELKFFDIQDGHGVVLLGRAGLKTVMISGRKSRINTRRAKEMKVSKVYQKAIDKLKVYEKMLRRFRVSHDQVCYIGDDHIDLPILRRAGFAVAVPNAAPELREAAHYVTKKNGGRGAVREVADLILKQQGKWQELMQRYFR